MQSTFTSGWKAEANSCLLPHWALKDWDFSLCEVFLVYFSETMDRAWQHGMVFVKELQQLFTGQLCNLIRSFHFLESERKRMRTFQNLFNVSLKFSFYCTLQWWRCIISSGKGHLSRPQSFHMVLLMVRLPQKQQSVLLCFPRSPNYQQQRTKQVFMCLISTGDVNADRNAAMQTP